MDVVSIGVRQYRDRLEFLDSTQLTVRRAPSVKLIMRLLALPYLPQTTQFSCF